MTLPVHQRNMRNVGLLRQKFRRALQTVAVTTAVTASVLVGCTRQSYRCKTDTEAYYLLDEKLRQSCEDANAPYRIEIDPLSRMFDPFNPDRPPMPEDDPQSNRFMRVVDRKKGYPLWEGNGRTNIVENPQWWSTLPLDERGILVLDMKEAVRTALMHNVDYQQAKEELYLSALDVSSERFLLDSQFFGGWQSSVTADGPRRNNGSNSSTVISTGPSSVARRPFSMQKQFATGADLIVGFANSVTWQIAGPNNQSATSLLDFSLIQPLLRQGGRDVVLERLTLAERTLLANVRAMERYKRAFYVDITTGLNSGNTAPQRRGGVFGGAGFAGFSALGGIFSGGGGGGLGGGGAIGANGYLGLLQSQLNIENQKENILQLEDIYLQFQDNFRELQLTMSDNLTALPQQQLQVAIQRQELYNAQTSLLTLLAGYESDLDQFKADLGLPPYLCVEIRDPLLQPYKLISQELRDRRVEVQQFRKDLGETNAAIMGLSRSEKDPVSGDTVRAIDASRGVATELQQLAARMEPLGELLSYIGETDVAAIERDIAILEKNLPIRMQQLRRLKAIAESERETVCSLLPFGDFNTSFLDGEGLEELPDQLREELARVQGIFTKHEKQLAEIIAATKSISTSLDRYSSDRERFVEIGDKIILGSQDFVAEVTDTVLALQIVQARARTESVLLPEVDLQPRDALEIARVNRRDWLNNRAALVNTWRSIEVVADDLESFLDLSLSGDIQNVGDNPLALRGSTGRLRAGLTWDAPITRLQERNNYRQSLISYQQAKRSYYQFEDTVWTSLRTTLRSILQNQLSFEIQRFAVQNAALQNSINADIRQINETLGQPSGATAAQDAQRGLTAFLSTQTTLIGTFVNYEALRRSLDLNLGTMQIDAEGLWIDPGALRIDTVGGALGDAIMNYGLTEGEVLLRDQIQTLDNLPIEVAPSDHMHSYPSDAVPGVGNTPAVSEPVPLPSLLDNSMYDAAPRQPINITRPRAADARRDLLELSRAKRLEAMEIPASRSNALQMPPLQLRIPDSIQ
ncbi:MAG: hypothetical protein KDB22_04640 [Planctomycetales bacterium]|nr:hypothetical protein [Planctomycetales bacterium]